jgi:hypothetical protein
MLAQLHTGTLQYTTNVLLKIWSHDYNHIVVFWFMILCSLNGGYACFKRTYCLNFLVGSEQSSSYLLNLAHNISIRLTLIHKGAPCTINSKSIKSYTSQNTSQKSILMLYSTSVSAFRLAQQWRGKWLWMINWEGYKEKWLWSLSWYCHRFKHNSQLLGWESNFKLPEFETWVLPIHLWHMCTKHSTTTFDP